MDQVVDAPVDGGPRCDPTKPFGAPTLVPGVNTVANEFTARLTADELTIYLEVGDWPDGGGVGYHDVWRATRATRSSAWSTPVLVPVVNTGSQEGGPSVPADGLTLFLHTDRSGPWEIWAASRPTTAVDFAAPIKLANVNSIGLAIHPYVRPDGLAMYLAIQASDAGSKYRIHRTVQSSGSFGIPTPIAEIASNADDSNPVITQSELVIFYSSNRTDGNAQGSDDIWTAKRASTNDAFGTPTNVTNLNSIAYEFPTWLSADGCELYFASSRSGGVGQLDIYTALRSK